MKSTLLRLTTVLSAAFALTCHADQADAQDKDKVTIKFKIFDTNEPTKRLTPVPKAINFIRNPVTLKADLQETVDISRPMKDGLDELKVSKGWLIERLVIDVDDPEKDYNFAAITKVISAADMTVYPGASRSTDRFAFQAYIAQMGAYRALLAEVLEEVDEGVRDRVRQNFRTAFERQLRNMSDLSARLPNAKPEELTAARRLRDEVLRLYGLMAPESPQPAVSEPTHQFMPPAPPCPCSPHKPRIPF